ncbi:LAGLIDADG family homing endonuclease [Bacillus sp. Marseille-Q3570]|uniref:LAGLIDADG family homing endonuclease n=1 Tax=Bacillus sp. Marseille-Q3570 TaxID=2963522 RepID=UPI0021B7D827|nr:LAGLIDADG family homing endonuclease [Bacillus sp. Marseille-Q3570]
MKNWEAVYLAGIIDGEGSITLTRMHEKEHRRPCVTIPSTDKELLDYIKTLINGSITKKKNYNPGIHKDSFTLNIKKKKDVFYVLQNITPYLRIKKKKLRAIWILENYDDVTPRNGKYNKELLIKKIKFEKDFFVF